MAKYTYTTQRQVRKAFWAAHKGLPNITPRRIRMYGLGTSRDTHNTDTRCAFVDFVDCLSKNSDISEALAQRVTL